MGRRWARHNNKKRIILRESKQGREGGRVGEQAGKGRKQGQFGEANCRGQAIRNRLGRSNNKKKNNPCGALGLELGKRIIRI